MLMVEQGFGHAWTRQLLLLMVYFHFIVRIRRRRFEGNSEKEKELFIVAKPPFQ
jgi:hypothetical protein